MPETPQVPLPSPDPEIPLSARQQERIEQRLAALESAPKLLPAPAPAAISEDKPSLRRRARTLDDDVEDELG